MSRTVAIERPHGLSPGVVDWAVALAGAALAQQVAGGGLFHGDPPPLPALLAGVVAFYSLGAYAPSDRVAVTGAIGGLAGLWASVLASGEIDVPSVVFPAGLLVAAPWFAGRSQSARTQRE